MFIWKSQTSEEDLMRVMKSLLVPVALSWITLSCLNNPLGPDVDTVTKDERALAITYAPGDSASSVTGNVFLPSSGNNGSSISWSTSTKSRITDEGVVRRPAASSGDATVTLTATISKGKAREVKAFTLTVKDKSYTGNTMNAGTVTDIDGNVYWAVKIGSQVWTVQNLRTTKYNDGTEIPYAKDSATWVNLTTPGYCYYKNMTKPDSIKKYGVLYNWYAVNTKKLAPEGWHVPTDAEWKTLENYLIANGYNWDGTTSGNKIAKSLAAKTDWYTQTGLDVGTIGNDMSKNNRSGFLALPCGSRNTDGKFDFGGSANWWTATEFNGSGGVARNLYYDYEELFWNSNYKRCGFSVRLVKD